jgi:hypothetical protein
MHLAFEDVKIDDLLKTPRWLKAHGITPLSFYGAKRDRMDASRCNLLTRSRWPLDRVSEGDTLDYKLRDIETCLVIDMSNVLSAITAQNSTIYS